MVVLNTLGSLGYVACVLQWFWVSIIFLPSLINSPLFQTFSPTDTTISPPLEQPVNPPSSGDIPFIVTAIALVVGVLIVIGAIYVILVKFPRSVAKTGETVTHTTAAVISPVIIRHTHLPAKQRRVIPITIIIVMKLLLVFVPLCLLFFARELTLAMSFELIMVIGVVLFSWSFVLFALQFVLSQLLRVNYKIVR